MEFPNVIKLKQCFSRDWVENVEEAVKFELVRYQPLIKKGSRIAIAVGSRGISDIVTITRSVVQWVKEKGGDPFIIPAMGSHGGATDEGQKMILQGYGISEISVGAPIISSMDVVQLPSDGLPNRVYMDRNAYEADGTIIINRVKPHTDFHGLVESGLTKMCVIGLGKQRQAEEIHRYGVRGLREMIVPTAQKVINFGNILFGIAVIENAYGDIALVRTVKPSDFISTDKELLIYAKRIMPSLPVDDLDILIIDEIGKDISGAVMDTNVIGRLRIRGEDEPLKPDIKIIVALDLTDASHGNATGIGLADIITRKLFNKIDLRTTYENIITSTFIDRGKIPIIAENEYQALEFALRSSRLSADDEAKIIRIKNTLKIDEFYASKNIFEKLNINNKVEMLSEFQDMFDKNSMFRKF